MKIQTSLQRIFLSFLLVALVLTSCQTTEQNVPESAEATSTATKAVAQEPSNPTNTLTPIPTSTPTPAPVETAIDLELADLPMGFLQIPDEIIGITTEQISGKEFSNYNPFLFYNPITDQLVLGFTILLTTDLDAETFNKILENPEPSMGAFINYYDATSVNVEPEIQGLDLSRISANLRVSLNVNISQTTTISYFASMVAFQTNGLGVYMIEVYNKEKNTSSIFPDYGILFSKKLEGLTNVTVMKNKKEPDVEQFVNWIDPGAWLLSNEYQRSKLEDIDVTEKELEALGIKPEHLFVYKKKDGIQVIVGLVDFLQSYEEVGFFDMQIDSDIGYVPNNQISQFLKDFIVATGGEIAVEKNLQNTQPLGHENIFGASNASGGRAISARLNEQDYEFEEIAFREKDIGLYLFTYQREDTYGKPGALSNQVQSTRLFRALKATQPFLKMYPTLEYNNLDEVNLEPPQPLKNSTEIPFQELLPNFIQTPQELLNVSTELVSGQSFTSASLFHLAGPVNSDAGSVTLAGFTVPLNNKNNLENFNSIIESPVDALTNMLDFYESSSFKVENINKTFLTLGEAQEYLSLNVVSPRDFNGIKMEMVAFKNNGVGYYFFITYSAYYAGATIFPDFPNRLVETMDKGSESTSPANTPLPLSLYEQPESINPLVAWIEPGKFLIPDGFERITLDDIRISQEEWSEIGFEYDTLYVYKNPKGPQIAVGYNILLNTYQDVGKFDMQIQDLDTQLIQLASAMGATSLEMIEPRERGAVSFSRCKNYKELEGNLSGEPYRFHIVRVREENIGFMIFTVERLGNSILSQKYYAAPEFTSDVCVAVSQPLKLTKTFRNAFPVYTIGELTGASSTP